MEGSEDNVVRGGEPWPNQRYEIGTSEQSKVECEMKEKVAEEGGVRPRGKDLHDPESWVRCGRTRRNRRLGVVLFTGFATGMALAALPGPALTQERDTLTAGQAVGVEQEEPPPVQAGPRRVSPRGAFIRSALIPGWGHAEVGALSRGAFYFSVEATSAMMLFKTQTRIARTRDRLNLRESILTARLEAQGITDPLEIEAALAADPEVEDLRALEGTRVDQREDWLAFGLFLMLIGGVDAYVSAHLADFPTAVVVEPAPAGGVGVGFSLSVGF